MMRKQHLHYGNLSKNCDLRTVERYFKGPLVGMPKRLPESRVYDFLNIVNSSYDEFVDYYLGLSASEEPPLSGQKMNLVGDGESESKAIAWPWVGKFYWAIFLSLFTVSTLVFLLLYWQSPSTRLIRNFHAVVPLEQNDCAAGKPFVQGLTPLAEEAILYSGQCFAVSLQWSGKGQLYLLSEMNGKLIRLYPNSCFALGYPQGLPAQASNLHFPLNRQGLPSMFKLDNNSGEEVIVALATTNRLSPQQQSTLDSIPSTCNDDSGVSSVSLYQVLDSWNRGEQLSLHIRHK